MTLQEKAEKWFFDGVTNTEWFYRSGCVSKDFILRQYLTRFPWENTMKDEGRSLDGQVY